MPNYEKIVNNKVNMSKEFEHSYLRNEIETNKKIKDTEYPRFTFEQGHPPDQILLDDIIFEDPSSDD